jgi:fructose-bisphosphate aldolase, class I
VLAEVHVPDASALGATNRADALAWGARTAREVGADLVKVGYPGSGDGMERICEFAGIPVVVAGGARRDAQEALRMADEALGGGAAGTAFSRNVIEHEAPYAMQRALSELVRDRKPLDEVYEALNRYTAEMRQPGAPMIDLEDSLTRSPQTRC